MLSHSAWPHRLSPSTTQNILRRILNAAPSTQPPQDAHSEESGIEPGHIPTITGSLASFTPFTHFREDEGDCDDGNDHHYETDHTDLGSSEGDEEAERKSLIMRDYDAEGFGEIPWSDLILAMGQTEFCDRVESGKREILLEKAHSATTNAITFQDFVNVMTGKRSRSFKCAVHHRDGEVCSENDFHILSWSTPVFRRIVTMVGEEFLNDKRDRTYYTDSYNCCPPPFFIIIVTILELSFFIYYNLPQNIHFDQVTNSTSSIPIDSMYIYRSDKRRDIWRFLLYVLIHAGWWHLCYNLLVQILIGIPLEMVYGPRRIALLYTAGVLSGSLGTSVLDNHNNVFLAGASGGAYALLFAHLSNVLLNYHNMRCGVVRLITTFGITSWDVGFAIYCRYYSASSSVSYVAHLSGCLTGLTMGLCVIKTFEQNLLSRRVCCWAILGFYGGSMAFAIVYNVVFLLNHQDISVKGLNS